MVKTEMKEEKGHPVRPIKLIENKRARKISYMKRKDSIKKKTKELATLCGINACSICFGPDGEIEMWPENPAEVKALIGMSRECGNKQNKKIPKFFAGLGEKVEEQGDADTPEKDSLKKALFGWDDAWLHGLSAESLKDFLKALDSRIEAATVRIELLKDKQKKEENVDAVVLDNPLSVYDYDPYGLFQTAVMLDNPLSVYDYDPYGLFQTTVSASGHTSDPMAPFDVPVGSTTPVWSMDCYYGDMKEKGIEYMRQGVEESGIYVDQLFFHDPDDFMVEICNCDNPSLGQCVGL